MLTEEMDSIVNKITNLLVKEEINLQTEMTSVKIMKIITELSNMVKNIKTVQDEIKDLSQDDTVRKLADVMKVILMDRRIRNILSLVQVEKIVAVLNEKETIVTAVNVAEDVAEGVTDAVLETLDDNQDGKVTSTEVSNNCTCCGNKKMAACWGKFVVNVLCCGKNNVKTYQEPEKKEVELKDIIIEEKSEEKII